MSESSVRRIECMTVVSTSFAVCEYGHYEGDVWALIHCFFMCELKLCAPARYVNALYILNLRRHFFHVPR